MVLCDKNQQGFHSIKGETFPHFGKKQYKALLDVQKFLIQCIVRHKALL
jgi:hypothetical protein